MDNLAPTLVHVIDRHLRPSLEMFKRCITICPENLWYERGSWPPVWEQIYHAIFWFSEWTRDWSTSMDYPTFHVEDALYLSSTDGKGISKTQILEYLDKVVRDYTSLALTLADSSLLTEHDQFEKKWTMADRLIGQIRHVQHHVGYLNAIMRSQRGISAEWIGYNE